MAKKLWGGDSTRVYALFVSVSKGNVIKRSYLIFTGGLPEFWTPLKPFFEPFYKYFFYLSFTCLYDQNCALCLIYSCKNPSKTNPRPTKKFWGQKKPLEFDPGYGLLLLVVCALERLAADCEDCLGTEDHQGSIHRRRTARGFFILLLLSFFLGLDKVSHKKEQGTCVKW